jgi:putative transposase
LKAKQPIAIDLTEIPYHGEPFRDPEEVRRGQPKSGTTHFHAYASAYVVRHGQRFTLALTPVGASEKMDEVVRRLLRQVRSIGVKVKFLLLDKGFFNAEVVRYLQRANCSFLMPAFARGRKPKRPRPGSLHEFRQRTRSGWGMYSWTSTEGLRATVSIAIVAKNYRGQRDRHGRRTQLYACWGLPCHSAKWIYETYRRRFGIETSYRQMNEARIRTTTRNPLLRFLFASLALILRNVWVWCHLNWLSVHRGRGIFLREELLRLGEMLLWLQELVEQEFQLCLEKPIPPPDP